MEVYLTKMIISQEGSDQTKTEEEDKEEEGRRDAELSGISSEHCSPTEGEDEKEDESIIQSRGKEDASKLTEDERRFLAQNLPGSHPRSGEGQPQQQKQQKEQRFTQKGLYNRLPTDARKSVQTKEEEDKEEDKVKKRTIFLQKHYSAKDGLLAEAVLIGDVPYYLISRATDPSNIEIQSSLEFADEILKPPEASSYINLPYRFDSETNLKECIQRAKKETLGSLLQKDMAMWRKYVDADDFHILIAAADEIYSYRQEKIGLTHYLFFTGGNNSGKSNNLTKIHYTAYRNMMSTDMTAANTYQFLGNRDDEGHGTICEDEADNIDESPDKMRIYKDGYTTGFPVLRTDTSFGRKQQKYNTFCFKAFAAERTPDSQKAKGFKQRIIEIQCFAGNPPCDILEIVNPAGDSENQKLLDELLDFRNTLLIHKLLHIHEPIPDIKDLNIHNREKQLFKPLIRLFQYEPCLQALLGVISEHISKKRAANVDSLHAYLYRTIKTMMISQKTMEFESSHIWQFIKIDLHGSEAKGKPTCYESDDYGLLSQKQIVGLLKDVFGAEPPRHNAKARKLVFNKDKFDRLDRVYNVNVEIIVKRQNEQSKENDIGLDKHLHSSSAETHETHETRLGGVNPLACDNVRGNSVIETIQNEQKSKEYSNNQPIIKAKIATENEEIKHDASDNPSHVSHPSPICTTKHILYSHIILANKSRYLSTFLPPHASNFNYQQPRHSNNHENEKTSLLEGYSSINSLHN
jgi:hypothetical protein